MKTLLLTALASIKRVGTCRHFRSTNRALSLGRLTPVQHWGPARLCAQGSYHSLQGPGSEPASAAPGGGRPSPSFARPVRALRQYMDRTQSFRTSEQLFVCYGGQQKGKAVSKQRMSHWIVDAITLAYEAQGVPCPLRLRAHSTRGVASSWALARGASLADICRAAGWATPNTFARFYSLRVEPVSSCVLTSNG